MKAELDEYTKEFEVEARDKFEAINHPSIPILGERLESEEFTRLHVVSKRVELSREYYGRTFFNVYVTYKQKRFKYNRSATRASRCHRPKPLITGLR